MKKAHFIRVLIAALMMLMSITPAFAAAPGNDDFNSAQAITALPFSATLNTVEATFAEDDPLCSSSSASVWFSFTPTADMGIEANTFGSNYDTTLSVYTGSRGNLTQITCNDDTEGLQSRVRAALTAGVTYYFMIAAFQDQAGGDLIFSVAPFSLSDPLTLELQIDHNARVDQQSGVATVHASITCSRPAYVSLSGALFQQLPRNTFVQGLAFDGIYCFETTPFSLSIGSDYLLTRFVTGPAKITLSAYVYEADLDRDTYVEAHERVILTGAHN
ncbi:MAG TPA: hypothetical protein VGD69_27245 [Herpetosiphonaceae bacterium]